jgi:Zn-dependent M28 family amino/carboxypeptidase
MIIHALALALCAGGSFAVDDSLALPWTEQVDAHRMGESVRKLASFGTRHTLSSADDPARGIGAARAWIKGQLAAAPGATGVEAKFEQFTLPAGPRTPNGANVVNVVAVVPGKNEKCRGRAYYVVGHYDSRNGDGLNAKDDAPGANDDASGVAVVIELSKLVAAKPLESTVVFLCTAGEEQGLLGATAHAKSVSAQKPYQIIAVLNNDIVGDPAYRPGSDGITAWPGGVNVTPDTMSSAAGPDPKSVVRVFSEGLPRTLTPEQLTKLRTLSAESDSPSRQIARFIEYVAGREGLEVRPMVVMRPDRFLRGGDHSAFNDEGFPAVRFTVLNEDYSRQHADVTTRDGKPYGDVPSFIDEDYLANVAKVNLAALVHMASAPSTPSHVRLITAKLDHNTVLRWDASPETDVAGYEVVWRATTEWQWSHALDVGQRRDVLLPINKDNVFFGVRSYDHEGFRSPVAFADESKE